jgi:spermidine synthase
VDIFEENVTPPAFETPDFLKVVYDLLRPGGMLLYNRLFQNVEDRLHTERFYEQVFRHSMPGAYKIDTGGNWILVSTKAE